MVEGVKQYVHFRCWAGLSAHTRRKNYMCIGGKNYLIIVLREGNHARFELLSKIFESFNVMRVSPLQSVYGHAKKGIIYA